jgi:hypothetical protein
MIRTEKKIDVVSPKGEVLVSFRITESEVPASNNGNGSNGSNRSNSKPPKTHMQHNGETMTDAQKKFLFRICADQGIEGEEAHTKLKELFGVESLKDVSKFDASKMIESMLAEAKGGNGNGPSF